MAGKRSPKGARERTITTAERDAQAARLRAQHLTYDDIAAQLGYSSRGHAYQAVQRALIAAVREPAEELRQIELDRLDALARTCQDVLARHHVVVSHGKVVAGSDGTPLADDGPVMQAVDRLLKIQERRAKLLGLDTPVKADVTVHQVDARDAELLEMINEARAAADQPEGPRQ